MTMRKFIHPQTTIQNNADIRHTLLLKFVGIQNIFLMRTRPPIDRARRITRMIFTHTKELRATATDARGNCPRIDSRPPWTNRNMTQTSHRREDEQLRFRFDLDLAAGHPQMVIDLRLDRFESITAAWTCDFITKRVG